MWKFDIEASEIQQLLCLFHLLGKQKSKKKPEQVHWRSHIRGTPIPMGLEGTGGGWGRDISKASCPMQEPGG
jgi:hypothetical protein